jgi:glutamate/tyrosine decarboxylase-like PLP-dependent enzyme
MTVPVRRTNVDETADLSPEELERMLQHVSRMARDYLRDLPHRAAFRPPPDELIRRLAAAPLPLTGETVDRVLAEIEADILPYSLGIGHPRWWGFVRASAAPLGAAADFLASLMNNNCTGSAQVATHVELTVVRWLASLIGYDAASQGLLTSGGSAANFIALAAMRETLLPGSRSEGMAGTGGGHTIYASTEVHSCVCRAVELLGFGSAALRRVPVDPAWRLDPAALEEMIRADRRAGLRPVAVVATAGTVNTGAVDPLHRIAAIARREHLWFHVDGAYGGVGAALPELALRYRGMDAADSLVLDPHKWLYVPYEVGAVLVRRRGALVKAFATRTDYLDVQDGDFFDGPVWYHEQGPQLSRSFRALKVWAVMRQLGRDGYRELWRRDIATAREVERLARAHPKLEVLGAGELSVCCFRYRPDRGDPNRFNRALLDAIHRDGRLFVSGTTLGGTFYLRACIINFRSTLDDARKAVETVVELGEILEESAALASDTTVA